MLRARAGWGFAAAGSPPRGDADDAPLDVVGATGLLAGRTFMARGLDELTLSGNGRFSSPEATTSRDTTLSTLVSEASTCSTSGSPGVEHAQILSARARRELERDLRRVHARINESAAAKEASDKMRAYVASKKKNAMRVMAKRGALVAPNARRVGDDDPDAIRRAAARALAAGVRRATPESSAELVRARVDAKAFGAGRDGDSNRASELLKNAGDKENAGVDAESEKARSRRRSMVGQRPPAPPSLTFAWGGFGGRPPAVLRKGGPRSERLAKDFSNDQDEDEDVGRDAEKARAPLADVENVAETFSFARFVPGTRMSPSTSGYSGSEGSPGPYEADHEPRLEVRGAFACVARAARRADGALARRARDEDGETRVCAKKKFDAPPSPRSAVPSAGSPNTCLPTLAGGLGRGSFAFASRSMSGFGVPSLYDDDGGTLAALACSGAEDEASDFENPADDDDCEYDFPSPAPSAAAAFIGLSRTSPASAYSAYSQWSAPNTPPPQFVLKGGFSELEHALYSGATVAFCGGGELSRRGEIAGDDGGELTAGGVSESFATRKDFQDDASYNSRGSFDAPTFGAGGFGAFRSDSNLVPHGSRAAEETEARGGPGLNSDDDFDDSEASGSEDSFDGFEGLRTPGLPDFAPTRVPSIETPPASASAAPSPRSAAIRAETEAGMATRIQAAFRGMRARRRRDALLSAEKKSR